jgi:hypothetical protein
VITPALVSFLISSLLAPWPVLWSGAADPPGETRGNGSSSPASDTNRSPPRRQPDPVAVARLIAGEPPIDDLRAAASALALAEPARARSMVQRARWSGLLPEVRFRVDRRFGRSESLDVSPVPLSDAPPVALDTVDEVRYEWRASWDLSRLIFNPDELGAHGEALRMADVRREVESVVIRLYFERRRLKIDALTADGYDVASNLRRDARIEELEAELDALTAGAFSRAAASRRPPPAASPWP